MLFTVSEVDRTFDEIFGEYVSDTTAFSAGEVTEAFTRMGVPMSEEPEKHFTSSHPGDDDWSSL